MTCFGSQLVIGLQLKLTPPNLDLYVRYRDLAQQYDDGYVRATEDC